MRLPAMIQLFVFAWITPPFFVMGQATSETASQVAISSDRSIVTIPAGVTVPIEFRKNGNETSSMVGHVILLRNLAPVMIDNRVLIPGFTEIRGWVKKLTTNRKTGRIDWRITLAFMKFVNGYVTAIPGELRITAFDSGEHPEMIIGQMTFERPLPLSGKRVADAARLADMHRITLKTANGIKVELRPVRPFSIKSANPGQGLFWRTTAPTLVNGKTVIPSNSEIHGWLDQALPAGADGSPRIQMRNVTIRLPNGEHALSAPRNVLLNLFLVEDGAREFVSSAEIIFDQVQLRSSDLPSVDLNGAQQNAAVPQSAIIVPAGTGMHLRTVLYHGPVLRYRALDSIRPKDPMQWNITEPVVVNHRRVIASGAVLSGSVDQIQRSDDGSYEITLYMPVVSIGDYRAAIAEPLTIRAQDAVVMTTTLEQSLLLESERLADVSQYRKLEERLRIQSSNVVHLPDIPDYRDLANDPVFPRP